MLREQQIFNRCSARHDRRDKTHAHKGPEAMEIDHNMNCLYNDRRRMLERHDRNPRHDNRDRHMDRRFITSLMSEWVLIRQIA